MKLFMCFGGAAPVADEAAAEQAARRQDKRAGGRRLPSFRWRRFFPGKLHGKKKRPSLPPLEPALAETKKQGTDMDDSGDGVFGAFTASPLSSSSRPNSASSLFSYCSSSPSSTPARSSGAVSRSLTASGALSPAPPPARRRHANGSSTTTTSPAASAEAVVLCLLLVVLCGRVGATLLTPTALYLFPWRWLAKSHRDEDDTLDSRLSATQRRRRPFVFSSHPFYPFGE